MRAGVPARRFDAVSSETSTSPRSSTGTDRAEDPSPQQAGDQPASQPTGAPDSPASAPLPPVALVLFGATGDLAAKMVLPAIAALAATGELPEQWRLIGNGRGQVSDEEFRDHLRDVLQPGDDGAVIDAEAFDQLAASVRFAGDGFSSEDPGQLPGVLGQALDELGEDAQVIHFLALPPTTFVPYTEALRDHGLADGARVIYEKPYGESKKNFEELDELVGSVFDEEDVFRIDHFLGKEATQQLHVLRYANRWIEQLWCADAVEQVQVDVPESLDVADRAEFYDATGAMKDMLVTHLLQVAAEVAMDPPADASAAAIAAGREAALADFRAIDPAEAVLGQADGYTDLEEVADGSTTDTFVAARVWVDSDRWRGVPFLLRSGKYLAGDAQQVSLVLRRPEDVVDGVDLGGDGDHRKALVVELSGDGRLRIGVSAQRPGSEGDLVDGELVMALPDLPGAAPLPPYASLLRDVMLGERALFTTPDGLAQTWRIVEHLADDQRPHVQAYAQGSWGPQAAHDLPGAVGWLTEQE